MKWFRKKSVPDIAALPAQSSSDSSWASHRSSPTYKNNNGLWTSWMYDVSEAELRQMMDAFVADLSTMTPWSKSQRAKTIQIFTEMKTTLVKIDRPVLVIPDAASIDKLIRATIPQALNTLRYELMDNSSDSAWSEEELQDVLLEAYKKHLMYAATRILPRKEAVLKAVSTAQVFEGDDVATQELCALQVVLEEASSKALTVEDKFVVEQTAQSYLPDAIRLFEGLRETLNPEVQSEASELFVRQIRLMGVPLARIVNQAATNQLEEMRTQVRFLESKGDGDAPSLVSDVMVTAPTSADWERAVKSGENGDIVEYQDEMGRRFWSDGSYDFEGEVIWHQDEDEDI